MKKASLPALLVASGLLCASIFSVNQPVLAATGKYAPAATVDSFFLTVGQTDPGETNLVCHEVKLIDQDTPVENLKVTIPGQENIPWVSLKNNTHTVCVDTSKPVSLNVLRLEVTDGEFVDLFEATVSVAAPRNTAPKVGFADLTAVLDEGNGKKCQELVVTDEEDAIAKLQFSLETKHAGLTLENGKVCVDTTKPLEQMPVTVAVTDTGDLQTKATAKVQVIAPPHIFVEPIEEQVREGEVCHHIDVSDLDSTEEEIVIAVKSQLPAGVTVKDHSLCADLSKPLEAMPVTLVATDETQLTDTQSVSVEITPAKAKPEGMDSPNLNLDKPKVQKQPKALPQTGGQSGTSAAHALVMLAAGGLLLGLRRSYVRR
ncbi:MAG: hypothetical protein Q4D73_00190 [Actinomycetaceae bacterium]|nr:hypothetical protein [Actinomycetaceae bacterium]